MGTLEWLTLGILLAIASLYWTIRSVVSDKFYAVSCFFITLGVVAMLWYVGIRQHYKSQESFRQSDQREEISERPKSPVRKGDQTEEIQKKSQSSLEKTQPKAALDKKEKEKQASREKEIPQMPAAAVTTPRKTEKTQPKAAPDEKGKEKHVSREEEPPKISAAPSKKICILRDRTLRAACDEITTRLENKCPGLDTISFMHETQSLFIEFEKEEIVVSFERMEETEIPSHAESMKLEELLKLIKVQKILSVQILPKQSPCEGRHILIVGM